MAKTLVVCGYGPGVSNAVAEHFGSKGFPIAIAARNPDRLKAAEKALQAKGIQAAGFPTDMASPEATRELFVRARAKFGPVGAFHWNSFAEGAGDLLTADPATLHKLFDVSVVSFLAAVRETLADLKAAQGAILVTNGGFGLMDPKVDASVVQYNAMGLGLANTAKMKTTRLLAEKLRPEGIYVGEVMIGGLVKGTPWDNGNGTVDPKDVATLFWDLYTKRDKLSASIQ
ncbi:MAG TPA: SDR family NAD(P)-dependent oxidoreductase [bacterium]|nr:SDR family NAD(P)-dependent oxidoreductase [bacterium]